MKYIVIVGATSGIGRGVAEIYARAGWRVGIAGRNEKVLKEIQDKYPSNVVAERIDVTDADAPLKLLHLIKRLGGMDIYLHASGIYFDNPTLNVAHDTAVARTNVVGFTALVDTAFRYFLTRGEGGTLGAISSVAGTKGIGEMAAYSASKCYQSTYIDALEQLSVKLGAEINFCDIKPGWTRTPLLDPSEKYLMAMSEEKVVIETVKALMRKSRVKVIDTRWRMLCAVWRRIPRKLWAHLDIPTHRPRE